MNPLEIINLPPMSPDKMLIDRARIAVAAISDPWKVGPKTVYCYSRVVTALRVGEVPNTGDVDWLEWSTGQHKM